MCRHPIQYDSAICLLGLSFPNGADSVETWRRLVDTPCRFHGDEPCNKNECLLPKRSIIQVEDSVRAARREETAFKKRMCE
jgi:hypothetical protein